MDALNSSIVTVRTFVISIHQRILKIMYQFPQIYGSSTTFSTLITIRNVSWEMFSNSALHHRNKLRFKISSNRKQLFDIVIFFTILLFLLFWANKCSLGERKRLLYKTTFARYTVYVWYLWALRQWCDERQMNESIWNGKNNTICLSSAAHYLKIIIRCLMV